MQKEDIDLPKEGDIVTWKQDARKNAKFIIKAKLGQRREHFIADSRIDHLIYEPEYELFIGQFPIDYVPERFPRFTENERVAFETEFDKELHAVKSIHFIEFSLMLNGAKRKATDASPYGLRGLDDPNQVKVIVNGYRRAGSAPYNTQQSFELELATGKELDASTKISKNGLDCYGFKNGYAGKRCFGKSKNASISGFNIHVPADIKSDMYGRSKEFIYGGVVVEWFTDQKNLYQAKEIDAAIWRLLETWNVAPIQKK